MNDALKPIAVFLFIIMFGILGWAIPILTRTSSLVYDPSSHQLCEVHQFFGIVTGMSCP